jgi:hypothetical protein
MVAPIAAHARSTGCGGETVCDYGPEPNPFSGIELTLRRGTTRGWYLTEVDAQSDGRFSVLVTLPHDVKPGEYFFSDDQKNRSAPIEVLPRRGQARVTKDSGD